MVLSWERRHSQGEVRLTAGRRTSRPRTFNLNYIKARFKTRNSSPNSPAYCLANLATSSLLKTYCLVAIQCRSSSTTRTVTPANTSSFKPRPSTAMAGTKLRGQTNSSESEHTWGGRGATNTPSAEGAWKQRLPHRPRAASACSANQRARLSRWRRQLHGCQHTLKPPFGSLDLFCRIMY